MHLTNDHYSNQLVWLIGFGWLLHSLDSVRRRDAFTSTSLVAPKTAIWVSSSNPSTVTQARPCVYNQTQLQSTRKVSNAFHRKLI